MKKLSFLFAALAAGMSLFASTAIERPEGLTDLTSPDASKVTTTSTGSWNVGPGTAFHDDGTYKDTAKRVLKTGTKCNIIYTFGAATKVNAYGIKMFENGCDSRTPGAWTFYGSNSYDPTTKAEPENTWTKLDSRSGELNWDKDGEYRYYEFENSTAYTSYKMDFTGTSGATDYIQFSYMEYFYHNTALPFLGDCALTKVEDGKYSLSGVLTKNDATAVKIVLSTSGQEDVVKTLGAATEGVPFEFEVTSEGLRTDVLYTATVIAENASGTTPPRTMSGRFFFGATPKVMDFKKKIDFVLSDEAQAALGESAVDGVPVAIRVSTDIRGFDYADMNASGTDVIFGAVDGNEVARYPYELEKWDPNGESVFWVKVPSLSVATTISMCYGNNVRVLDNDPTGVWSDYVGVWHMTGGSGAETDATGHGLTGTPTGSKLPEMASDANAPVGLGRVNQTTAGKYNRLSVPNYNDFISDHSLFTVSGWFKSTNETGYPRPMSRKTSYDQGEGWEIQYNSNSKTQCEMRGSSSTQVTMDGPDVTADWVHLSYVFNGTTGTAYANGGASKKSGTITAVKTRTDPMAIGNNSNGSEQGWCGSYDEVRMFNGVQSDVRVKSEYLAMTPGFLVNDGAKPLDPEAPVLGECALTKVRDGEYRVDGVMAKNGAAVKLVFSAVGGEVVEKSLGDQVEGVPFTTSITKADGLSDAYPYDVKIVVANDHGAQEKSLGVIGLWFPTSVNDFAKKFTVTVPETVTEVLEGFPLLVRLSVANVEGFDYGDIQQDGADIVAADAAGNFLPCELQKYDPNGESLLWVRVPSMAAGTEITIYYGNPKPLIEIPSAKDTWSDYAGVWHLDETTAGTTALRDSTSNATDGTAHTKSLVSEGVLGGARGRTDATGTNGAMATMPKNAALDALTPEFTVSGWLMPTTTSISWAYVFSRKSSDSYKSWGWQFRAESSLGSIGIYASGTSDNDSQRNVFSQSTIKQNVWTKYTVAYTSTKVSLYLDGKLVATQDIKPGAAVNGDLDFTLGGLNGSGHGTLKGYHDEVRLRRGAVGADWAAAEYAQETGVFGTYGAAEAVDSSAPVFLAPIATVSAQGEVTVTITVVEGSGSVYVDVDGEKTKIGDIDTEGTFPQEFVAHPTMDLRGRLGKW